VSKSLGLFCESKGDIVSYVHSFTDALTYLFNKKYDLIVTTLYLDKSDGVQLITTLKNSDTLNSGVNPVDRTILQLISEQA
jgi:DNA-binding response OmpR family regulator